jgi:glycosyltransferase involved in cell wall biosynthesis
LLAAKMARVPIRLHTVGGIPWMEIIGIKKKILKYIEILTYSFAHKIYPNSKGLSHFILEQKLCDANKLKVLANGGSNGIDTEYFMPDPMVRITMRAKHNIQDDEIVLGFVGRIASEKGINEWLQAFEKIRKSYKVKILLIGLFEKVYGGLNPEVEERIKHDPDILWLGRFDDVRPYYNMMDIFVFPSYREGFPNAVLEACSMGLPVIATNINGCNEIIIHEYNGLLIPPKSSKALTDGLTSMIKNKAISQKYGQTARNYVVENFQNRIIWNSIKKEYDSFLGQKFKV